jgi:hypothetical protein
MGRRSAARPPPPLPAAESTACARFLVIEYPAVTAVEENVRRETEHKSFYNPGQTREPAGTVDWYGAGNYARVES